MVQRCSVKLLILPPYRDSYGLDVNDENGELDM